MIGDGCEPYSFDFGEDEYMEWLERWLTPAELAEWERRWEAYRRVDPLTSWQFGHSLVRLRVALGVRALLWPARKVRLRRVKAIVRFAIERSGHGPPGPSWKIRHEFGVAHGDR